MLAIAFLQGTLLSGLTFFMLMNSHLKQMDNALARLLRYMMRMRLGKPAEGRRIPQREVFLYWRICPCRLELLSRRLRAYQRWAGQPKQHVAELGAVFATTRLDKEAERPRTSTTGGLLPTSTPWAHQFYEDIENLSEAMEEECWWAAAARADYASLFRSGPVSEAFACIDVAEVKARLLQKWAEKRGQRPSLRHHR